MNSVLKQSLKRAFAVCAVTAVLVATDPFTMGLYRHVAPKGRWAEALAQALTYSLELHMVAIGIVLYTVLVRSERLRRLAVIGGASLTQAMTVDVVKTLAARPRPADLSDAVVFGAADDLGGRSFPSGHATSAFALATVLAAWYPRWRVAFYTAAVLVTWSRIHLDRHFPGDCFMGACLGSYIALCFIRYVWQRNSPLNRAEIDAQQRR
jgi:undecaprenyl-diphosphatase